MEGGPKAEQRQGYEKWQGHGGVGAQGQGQRYMCDYGEIGGVPKVEQRQGYEQRYRDTDRWRSRNTGTETKGTTKKHKQVHDTQHRLTKAKSRLTTL